MPGQNWVDLVPKVPYDADGTGRDTYIRRDPVYTNGKTLYKPEVPSVTRFGAAGSRLPSESRTGFQGHVPGARDEIGLDSDAVDGSAIDAVAAQTLGRTPVEPKFPIEVGKYTTMKELMQDRHVTDCTMPGHLNHIASYKGHQPRNPSPAENVATWQKMSTMPGM